MTQKIRMFVNGQAMSGGSLYGPFTGLKRQDVDRTAPKYTFHSVRDEFPGLHPAATGGIAVHGELYEVDYATLRDVILPAEPPELELTVIELADGTGSLCMQLRDGQIGAAGVTDISRWGSWRAYKDHREG